MTRLAALITFAFLAALAVAPPVVAAEHETETGADALTRWTENPETVFDAAEVDLAQFKWIARPLVVFAETPADPAFARQMDLLAARMHELVDRDVVIITDADPSARTEIRRQLRPRAFMLTLLGKDGRVIFRKPFPWDVREISRSIDKQPERRQELRDRATQAAE